MAFGADNSPRPALLSLIMLAVLVASVAAAWLVALPRQEAHAQAVQVVASLNAQGLESYWAAHGQAYFIAYDMADQPIGWRATILSRAGGADFREQTVTSLPQAFTSQSWNIGADAKEAIYAESVNGHRILEFGATIHDGTAQAAILRSVRGRVQGPPFKSDNYLLPGTLSVAIADVARRGRKAAFETDDLGLARKGDFATAIVTVASIGPGKVTVDATANESTTVATYALMPDGSIAQMELNDGRSKITFKRATAEQLLGQFRNDLLLKANLGREAQDGIQTDDPGENQSPGEPE